jgi:hypothetical protein
VKVREHYIPKIDEKKKMEVEMHKLETLDPKEKRAISLRPYQIGDLDANVRYSGSQNNSIDYQDGNQRQDGLRNLQELHQRMKGYR